MDADKIKRQLKRFEPLQFDWLNDSAIVKVTAWMILLWLELDKGGK